MYTADELRALADAYVKATGVSRSGLSRTITGAQDSSSGNDKLIIRLLDGGACSMKHGELMSRWFEQNWPDGVPWPLDAPKECSPREAAE
jgi:hypothetical protein